MAKILDKIMHDGDEYDFPEWFSPESAGTQWQVLTKGSGDTYDWSNPPVATATVDSTAPANPVQWQLRYDTANNVLRVYYWGTWS